MGEGGVEDFKDFIFDISSCQTISFEASRSGLAVRAVLWRRVLHKGEVGCWVWNALLSPFGKGGIWLIR